MSDRHYVHHENEVQLAKLLKESKPFFERYGTTMIYGVAALMAITAVVVYFQRQPDPTAEVSRDLLLATTAEDYQAVADESPDSPIGILARLRQADRELEDAVGVAVIWVERPPPGPEWEAVRDRLGGAAAA